MNDMSFDTLQFQLAITLLRGAFAAGSLGTVVLSLYTFDVLR
eukprot:IDg14600t1